MAIAQHSSLSNEHYTPPAVISLAREVMGTIDLDPCSNRAVNDWSVSATEYWSLDEGVDGLERLAMLPSGQSFRVWCNPPGGRTKNRSNARIWLHAILDAWERQAIKQAFFLLFNREHLGDPRLAAIPRLNFEKRLRYYAWNKEEGQFKEGNYNSRGHWVNAPTQSSSLLYLPPLDPWAWTSQCDFLMDVFGSRLGTWVIPPCPLQI